MVWLVGRDGHAGCDTPQPSRPRWEPLTAYPDQQAEPYVAVYGDLVRLLPDYRDASWVETFVHGPDVGRQIPLRNPQGMAWLGRRLLVCDQGYPAVIAIDLGTGECCTWGSRQHAPRCPTAIAVDAAGTVYVADTTRETILVYDLDGRFVRDLADDTPVGFGYFRPCSVAVVEDVLFVSHVMGKRIDRFLISDRQWLDPWQPPASESPLVAPTGLCSGPDGQLLIADAMAGVVRRVSAEGEWLSSIGRPGRRPGEFVRPKQVCRTDSGYIVITDSGRQSVVVYRDDGRYVTEIVESRAEWAGWTLPVGVAVIPTERVTASLEGEPGAADLPPQMIIVSDMLGSVSLTVMGIQNRRLESTNEPL